MIGPTRSSRPTSSVRASSAGRLAAATCRWLLLIAEFDRREGCARFGIWSTARWLSHHCGIAHRTALEQVRVARALAAFPELAAEMSAGRLSYSQVRAISRVLREGGHHEGEHQLAGDLIEIAQRGSASQLESMLRGVRTADELDDATDQPREYLRTGWTPTQQWSLTSRLDPERGAVVGNAVRELARAEQITVADALVRMAEIALTVLREGDTTTRALRGEELAAVVIHVTAGSPGTAEDPTGLAEDPTGSAEPRPAERTPTARSAQRAPSARIEDGPALPRRVLERLACAGRVRTVVHDCDGTPLDVGRSQRLVTRKQFRALLDRDRGCRHPGCGSRRFLHAHHVRHWLHGGPTNLANLILLCGTHHRALHDGAFRLEALSKSSWRFIRADGRELLAAISPADYADPAGALDNEYPTAPEAPTTRWAGERLDRHFAVSVLAERRAAAGDVAGDRTERRRGAWPADYDPWAVRPA